MDNAVHTNSGIARDICLFATAQSNKAGCLSVEPSQDAARNMIDELFTRKDQTDLTADRFSSITE